MTKLWTVLILLLFAAYLTDFLKDYSLAFFWRYCSSNIFDFRYFYWFYWRKLTILCILCVFIISYFKYYYLFNLVPLNSVSFSINRLYYISLASVALRWVYGSLFIFFYYKNIFSKKRFFEYWVRAVFCLFDFYIAD